MSNIKRDGSYRTIYNISVSHDCFKELQHMEIDEGIKIPELCSRIIEKFTSKKPKSSDISKIIELS